MLRTLVVVCLLVAAIPAVTAFTATLVEPASSIVLHNGDRITIRIDDLADNEYIHFDAYTDDMVPSVTSYTFSNLEMPFRIERRHQHFKTMGVGANRITDPTMEISKHGGASVSYTGSTTYLSYSPIPKGVYDISVSGTPADDTVGLGLVIQGLSKPPIPNPSTFTFTLQGVSSGHLRIQVAGEGSPVLSKTFIMYP